MFGLIGVVDYSGVLSDVRLRIPLLTLLGELALIGLVVQIGAIVSRFKRERGTG